MGSSENSKYSAQEKQDVLKAAGRLDVTLEKSIEAFKAMDHNELDLAFDKLAQEQAASSQAHHTTVAPD